MKLWNKINWPAMNLRARNIEADLQRWPPAPDALKDPETISPNSQTDRTIAQALMVWSDDGGPAA